MFESGQADSRVDSAVRQLAAGWDELAAIDPAALSGEELLDLLDLLETDARRRTAVACGMIAELDARAAAGELGYPSAAVLLSERLRIGRREAAGRVRLSADLAARHALSGERLQPRFPQVASALADGVISARHAAIICATVDRLPDRVVADQPELVAQVEPTLLVHARNLDPERLAVVARRVVACLDPDGVLATDRDQARRRDATLVTLPDGSGRLTATLTSEAVAVWTTVLDTLSRPVPAEGAEPDRRTPGQRRHDALVDAGRRLLRSGDLPDAGGTPATVLLTLTLDQLETRLGLATTAHGGTGRAPARRRRPDRSRCPRHPRSRAAPRPHPPHRQPRPTPRPRRPRPGLFLPSLRPAPRLVRNPPCESVGRRGYHRPAQPHAAMRLSSPGAQQTRLDGPRGPRPARMDSTSLDRPPPGPPPQRHPPPTPPFPTLDAYGGSTAQHPDREAADRSGPARVRQLGRLGRISRSSPRRRAGGPAPFAAN
jgi:Domain of unknown function (DUF222)